MRSNGSEMENLHVRSVAGNPQGQPYEYLKVVFEAGLIIVLGHQTETWLSQKLISFRQTIAQDKVKKSIALKMGACIRSLD